MEYVITNIQNVDSPLPLQEVVMAPWISANHWLSKLALVGTISLKIIEYLESQTVSLNGQTVLNWNMGHAFNSFMITNFLSKGISSRMHKNFCKVC